MNIYLKLILGLLFTSLLGYGVKAIYTAGDDSGYNRKSKEIADDMKLLREERAKYLMAFTQFKEASKAILELKIKGAEIAYLDGVDYGKAQANAAIADIPHSGLSVNIKREGPSARSCPTTPTGDITNSDETKRAKLSDKDAEFFISFANEADETVRQLTACQVNLESLRVYLSDLNSWAKLNNFTVNK